MKIASEVDSETVKLVRTGLLFDRLQNVKTVVFITTPHRGSELADVGIVQRIGQILLALPKSAQKRLKPLTELRSFNDFGNSGVENLSTKHPYFAALARHEAVVPYPHGCVERSGTVGAVMKIRRGS